MPVKNKEHLLRDPKPGTAAAFARDFGIDLTLIIDRLRRSPEQRIRQLDEMRDGINNLKAAARLVRPHERD